MAWVDTLAARLLPRRLGLLTACTLGVGLGLFALECALRLPAGHGVSQFQGWRGAGLLRAALALYAAPEFSRWWLAVAWMVLSSALFMPLYGMWLAVVIVRFTQVPGLRWLRAGLGGGLAAALVVGLFDNLGGLQRLQVHPLWWALSVGAGGLLAWRMWVSPSPSEVEAQVAAGAWPRALWRWWRLRPVCALVWTVLTVAALAGPQSPTLGPSGALAGEITLWLNWAPDWMPAGVHGLKKVLLGLVGVGLALAVGIWWFGLLQPEAVRAERARFRAGALGVIGRSRYVLILLALLAGLTLGLPQCRDVLMAMAWAPIKAQAAWQKQGDWAPWAWTLFVLLSSLVATGLLSQGCWQWTRLAVMVRREGTSPPDLHSDDPVPVAVGRFAQHWARLLGAAPVVIICVLISQTLGDAVLGTVVQLRLQQAAAGSLLGAYQVPLGALQISFVMLLGFASGAVALVTWLSRRRHQMSLSDPRLYHNAIGGDDPQQVYEVLLTDRFRQLGPHGLRSAGADLPRPLPWLQARWAPLVALACLASIRTVADLSDPSLAGYLPPTFPVVLLALAWWLGPLGLMAMAEQNSGMPWGLLPVGVAVLATGHNHLLPMGAVNQITQVDGLQMSLVLCALGLTFWCAALWVVRRGLNRLGWTAGGVALLMLAVVSFVPARVPQGLQALHTPPELQPATASGPQALQSPTATKSEGQALASRTAPAVPPKRIFLVAAEGGGIRSAYWTALSLATLHDQLEGQPLIFSGVSGGSVGGAVYAACRSPGATGQQVLACVKQGIEKLDALTPLLGGLMFEDVFAQVLPATWLCRDFGEGCRVISRAVQAERAFRQAWPGLAAPLNAYSASEQPWLLFNTTWTETGERAVLSSQPFRPHDMPGVIDLLSSAPDTEGQQADRSTVSLITAGHASARFPYVNPLVTLPEGLKAAPDGGHLADGGYNENSGAGTLMQAWQAWQRANPAVQAQPVLLLIRNGVAEPDCVNTGAVVGNRHEPSADCLQVRSMQAQPGASALMAPGQASSMRFLIGAMGPAVTALNAIGIGAQARMAVGQLVQAVCEVPGGGVWTLDQANAEVSAPLGWYLSPNSRRFMEAQLHGVHAVVEALERHTTSPVGEGLFRSEAYCRGLPTSG
jgi:hypothetical protein